MSTLVMYLTALVFCILVCLFAFYRWLSTRNSVPKGLKALPGPKGLPIIGSVHEVPEKNNFIKFYEWGKEYGPIYQTNLAGHNHVWISSDAIARNLLAKKGNIYSDRPHIPGVIDDNRTSAQYLPLMSRNDAWTRQRRFANHIMRQSEKAKFYRYPELESIRMCMELMESPQTYNHILESFISRVTCRLAWGRSEASDELKQRARELLYSVSPTGHLGNKLPFVMSLPDWLSPAKAWERRRAKTERRFFEIMQGEVRSDMLQKHAPDSWTKMFFGLNETWDFKEEIEGAYMVGMHGIAGALTIAAPIQGFCLAMCYHPQYLGMLHEEIDRVCGDRMPRAEDRRNLPVLRAIIRECIRWRPPVPTGIPHELTEDDEYEGYHIPAKSVMHPLEWAISRDPLMYPDPETFNPMRWLDPKFPTYREPLTEYPTIINSSQFGYGRRVCQGQMVADEDLLVGIASVAWLFNIERENVSSATSDSQEEPVIGPLGKHWGASVSREELVTGHDADNVSVSSEEKELPGSYTDKKEATVSVKAIPIDSENELKIAGAFPQPTPEEAAAELRKTMESKQQSDDPTLDYTTLLIAKPNPFNFSLTVRNGVRAELVRTQFRAKKETGEFSDSRVYWGENEELGWSKV